MRKLWNLILGNQTGDSDPASIEILQSRVPSRSKSDFDFITKHMDSWELFPKIMEPDRSALKERLLKISKSIPSMHTLMKDIRYLKSAAKMMSLLIPESRPRSARPASIRERFQFIFGRVDDNRLEIQTGPHIYRKVTDNDYLNRFDISYQQLWLCSFRICTKANPYGRRALAVLADRLGFWSTEIKRELEKDAGVAAVEKAVLEVLRTLRPSEDIIFNPNDSSDEMRIE